MSYFCRNDQKLWYSSLVWGRKLYNKIKARNRWKDQNCAASDDDLWHVSQMWCQEWTWLNTQDTLEELRASFSASSTLSHLVKNLNLCSHTFAAANISWGGIRLHSPFSDGNKKMVKRLVLICYFTQALTVLYTTCSTHPKHCFLHLNAFYLTFTLQWAHWRTIWGSVSCPRILKHADLSSQ